MNRHTYIHTCRLIYIDNYFVIKYCWIRQDTFLYWSSMDVLCTCCFFYHKMPMISILELLKGIANCFTFCITYYAISPINEYRTFSHNVFSKLFEFLLKSVFCWSISLLPTFMITCHNLHKKPSVQKVYWILDPGNFIYVCLISDNSLSIKDKK